MFNSDNQNQQQRRSPNLRLFAWAAVIMTLLSLGFLVVIYLETRTVLRATAPKPEIQFPVTVSRYDSATQIKIDTIEARRSVSHRHVDNLYSGELQSLLDSLYNSVSE